MLKKAKYIVITLTKGAMMASFIGLVLVVLLQIFARFFLPKAPAWTEEIARFFMIYIVALGVGFAVKQKLFIRVDFFETMISPFPRVVLRKIVRIFCVGLMILFLYHSISMVKIGFYQYAASLRFSMGYVYISMFILPISIIIAYFHEEIILYKRKKE